MLENAGVFKTVKLIALNNGYTENQIEIALKYIDKSNLSIKLKNDSLYDVVNEQTGEYLDESISLEMVIERGFDCLRNDIEKYLRDNSSVDMNLVNNLLFELNSMFENSQYTIKELDGVKYLSLNI